MQCQQYHASQRHCQQCKSALNVPWALAVVAVIDGGTPPLIAAVDGMLAVKAAVLDPP